MALTNIQREVCRVLAKQRIASGESYVAGGAALNTLLDAPRVSQDLDLFHDTAAALAATWDALAREEIRFHAGSIRGAFPQIIGTDAQQHPGRR